jgi:hypothetical protein
MSLGMERNGVKFRPGKAPKGMITRYPEGV